MGQRSVVSMSKDVAMPDPPAICKSDKDVVGTIADKCPKLAAAIKAAGLDSALSGGPFTVFAPIDSAVSGDISADALKFHVATNQQLPTRNGKSYVTLCDDKEVALKLLSTPASPSPFTVPSHLPRWPRSPRW